jgi:hypothetical protein
MAQLVLASLTGKSESRQTELKFFPLPPSGAALKQARGEELRPLSLFKDIRIEVAGSPLGRFYDPNVDHREYCAPPSCDFKVDVFKDAVSLIGLAGGQRSLLDSPFLALDFPLREGMSVTARTFLRGKLKSERELGSVHLLHPALPIGWADTGIVRYNFDDGNMAAVWDGTFDAVEFRVGGRAILRGKQGAPNGLSPAAGARLLVVRGDGRVRLDAPIPSSGMAYLRFRTAAATTRAAIAVYRKEESIVPVAAVAKPLARGRAPARRKILITDR